MTNRTATPADIDAIQAIAEHSWTTDYPGIMTRETASEGVDDWYGRSQLETELARDRTVILVAERDGTVVGFSHADWNEDEAVGYILRIYVHPDHRRAGVGYELLEQTCAAVASHDIDRIDAMVLADNDPGNAFYDRYGFEYVDEHQTTIGDETYPENRYALERPFDLDTD